MARRHYVLALPSEAATLALAGALARVVPGGSDVHLEGELAAGKTTFARGFLRALGHAGPVKSPTFTLVECYEFAPGRSTGRPDLRAVHHFDLYRLGEPAELLALGFEDYHEPDAVCLIEWPRRGGSLPAPAVRVELTATGPESRLAVLELEPGVPEESAAEFEVLVANIK